jgi:hypothetical protein
MNVDFVVSLVGAFGIWLAIRVDAKLKTERARMREPLHTAQMVRRR